jgi:glycosyltransferase involved in cell wall biosynthesis
LSNSESASLANPSVITPAMWPSFRPSWARRLNAELVGRAIRVALRRSQRAAGEPRILLTTLPIAAALTGHVHADAWIYYCVDDFASWPSLDAELMRSLERALLQRADGIVATSAVLQQRLASESGRPVTLLTHGVDLGLWRSCATASPAPDDASRFRFGGLTLERPVILFWGLIDRRLDVDWLRALVNSPSCPTGSLVLVGPQQAPDPALVSLPRVVLPGPVPYEQLPLWAAAADVLIMPYTDAPVTRAMQPLKLKEYLATGKPVVARHLPATAEWADAADIVDSAEAFVRTITTRLREGAPSAQLAARGRLETESWEAKASDLEAILLSCCGANSAG